MPSFFIRTTTTLTNALSGICPQMGMKIATNMESGVSQASTSMRDHVQSVVMDDSHTGDDLSLHSVERMKV